jgi:P-type Ca2+ transporter type 2C
MVEQHKFWAISAKEVVEVLETDAQNGLSEAEARERLEKFGENIIEKRHQTGQVLIFLRQFKSPLILILVLASGVTLAIGHARDAVFIFAAVAVNAVLGFYQERKAEQALAELKTYLKQHARVVREAKEKEMDADQLVPGDIIRIAQGDRVPADARLLFANDLQIDEAILTGESSPGNKQTDAVPEKSAVGDQRSMMFAGTLVTQGVGTAVVCRTGFITELGKIASLVAASETTPTPLQVAIKRFSIRSAIFLGAFTSVVFVAGISAGYSWLEMFLTSIAIAVSAIPEGLPIALTVILAIGVQRMARRKGVIRRLLAAEALGSTTVVLTDKTGTLTMAKMELSSVVPLADDTEQTLLELALLNSSVVIENPKDPPTEWRIDGRVLETTLVRAAALRGVTKEKGEQAYTVLHSVPFNAVNKFSVSLVHHQGKHKLVFFGAPDILVHHTELGAKERQTVLDTIHEHAQSGELVVGVAIKEINEQKDFSFSRSKHLKDLVFQGLIAFRDPVRPGVKQAIQRIRRAGITTVIVTGDHRGTAEAVARQVGIPIGKNGILDARELLELSDAELQKRLPSLRVIARVAPMDKVRIAQAFQKVGEVVAMTGDGVNDAPSIKQANIGIAMGSGTAVARDVADLVLLDDNFETIVAAIEEGRQITSNIRKVIVYLLSNVADGLFLIGGALLMGVNLPLNALQILWVNFFSDSFPAVAFAFETDPNELKTRGRNLKSGLLDPLMRFLVLYVGLTTSALLFVLYWFLLQKGFPENLVSTFTFACFGTYTLFLAFSVRSLEQPITSYKLFSNKYLVMGAGIGILLMLAAIYVPVLQSVLHTVPLPLEWLVAVVAVGILNITAVEFGKYLFRK